MDRRKTLVTTLEGSGRLHYSTDERVLRWPWRFQIQPRHRLEQPLQGLLFSLRVPSPEDHCFYHQAEGRLL